MVTGLLRFSFYAVDSMLVDVDRGKKITCPIYGTGLVLHFARWTPGEGSLDHFW